MKKFAFFLALMVCSFKASAQTVVAEWNCDNTVAATFTDPVFVASATNLTSSGAALSTYVVGCPGPSPDMMATWNGWSVTQTYNPSSFVQFSISFSQASSLTWLRLFTNRTSAGPTAWQLRWSVNAYSAPLYTNTTFVTGCVGHSVNLGSTGVLTGQTVTFRLYAGDALGPSGRFNLDDIQLEVLGSTLPITLVSFDGEVAGHDTRLRWQTASEDGNSHFTVLRSSDFEQWESVGTVPGAGNSQALRDYVFYDRSPLPGTSYYRLMQTDFDGTFEEFPHVVPVTHRKVTGTYYQVGDIFELASSSTIVDHAGRVVSPLGQTHRLHMAGTFIARSEDGTVVRIIVSD